MKTLTCFLLFTAVTLTAGELTGKWSGKFDVTNSNGDTKPGEAVLNLKLEGTTVTGTAGPSQDQQWTIRNGKLEAGKLTFEVVTQHDGADNGTIVFDLVFNGDTIQGSATGTAPSRRRLQPRCRPSPIPAKIE